MSKTIVIFAALLAITMVTAFANATPILTTSVPKPSTKQEAVMALINKQRVFKCTEQVLTKNMTVKAKGSDNE